MIGAVSTCHCTFNFQYISNDYFSTGIVSFRCDIFPNLIELFWNNTKSFAAAHFNYCSVDSEKIPPVLPPLTTMLVIQIDYTFFTGIAHLNLKGSPKPVALP